MHDLAAVNGLIGQVRYLSRRDVEAACKLARDMAAEADLAEARAKRTGDTAAALKIRAAAQKNKAITDALAALKEAVGDPPAHTPEVEDDDD